MDGIFTLAERQRGGAHGISAAAARNDIGQIGLVVLDLGGRRPSRTQILAADDGGTGPLLAGAPDAYGIPHCPAVSEHVIERAFAGSHYNRAGGISAGKADDIAGLRVLRDCSRRNKRQRGRSGRRPS